ncbi:MAG: hypothetical protein AAFX99_00410 [Myxococcota bacterium]
MNPLHQDDQRRLTWIRRICLGEFILANLLGIALVIGALWMPQQLDALRLAGVGLVVPAFIGGAALLLFHAKVSGRPWVTTLAELGTWAVFPLPAVALLYLLATPPL